MEPIQLTATLSTDDLKALRLAKAQLESSSLTMKLAGMVGSPVEKLISSLPAVANEKIADATQIALRKCLQIALRTLGKAEQSSSGAFEKPSNLLHKLAVATTGAAGGAFGFLALPVELPVTTTLMFRSICDIARSEGEDLTAIDSQLQCLAVLGMGSLPKAGSAGEDAEFGYFLVRGALAQQVSKASSEIAAKGFTAHSSTALVRLVNAIASRFSVQVSEQVAAKSIPAIGAVLGAMVNTVFIDHFQQMAHGHFTVRRLERRYGLEAVKAAYQTIDVSLDA
ncbi:EcsC family protein [Trinickia sp. YCB016]